MEIQIETDKGHQCSLISNEVLVKVKFQFSENDDDKEVEVEEEKEKEKEKEKEEEKEKEKEEEKKNTSIGTPKGTYKTLAGYGLATTGGCSTWGGRGKLKATPPTLRKV